MSWLEMSWPAQALRALGVYVWYLTRHQALADSGAFDGADGLKLLGWELLLLIMVTVTVGIALQIAFVVTAIATGQESRNGFDEDERDKQIEARAMVYGFNMTALGFVAMVLALWQGWGAVWAVNIMVTGMVLADMTVNLTKFFRYWRGG
jgi:hypothetical protein